MLKVEYTTGIKINGKYEPLESLDNLILLSSNTYIDAVTKLGRIYMEYKEYELSPGIEVDATLENNDDFFAILKPIIDKIAAFMNVNFEGENYKAQFINLINRADAMGTILFDLGDYSLNLITEANSVLSGLKISDETGGVVYSFDTRDLDDFGRMRIK